MDNLRRSSVWRDARRLLPAAGALLLCACATSTTTGGLRSSGSAAGVYGIAGDRLLTLGEVPGFAPPAGGQSKPVELSDVGAMTYDPGTRRFYAIADASSKPRLIAVDPATGEATAIGPVETPGLKITIADAIAVDPRDGTLYAAGGKSTFASNVLLRVDPETGAAEQVGPIRGTIQDEIDAMAFAGGELYAVDGGGNSSALYRLDTGTGQASRIGEPFAGAVTDVAFDPISQRLIGAQGTSGSLLSISLKSATVSELQATAPVTAVAVIPLAASASLFEDGFESGDSSAWSQTSRKTKKKRKKP